MPGVRIDRFLASTAVVLLLSGAAGGVFAEPKFGSMADGTAPPASAAKPPEVALRAGSAGRFEAAGSDRTVGRGDCQARRYE